MTRLNVYLVMFIVDDNTERLLSGFHIDISM